MFFVSRTALTVLAGLVAVPMTPVAHVSPSTAPVAVEATPVAYNATQKEFFLAPDQFAFIRPGLNLKIASVTNFGPGQKPVVEFFMTDDLKQPLDRTGGLTPGVVSVRFIPAVWNPTTRRYTNYIVSGGNPSRDTTGTFQDLETGHYKYTFANALPATMDPSQPHTVALMGSRNTTDFVGKIYYAVPQYVDFTPSTGAAATTFNATTIAKCNQCHDPLAPHGGNYRDIKTCVLCHNPNNMVGTIVVTAGEPAEQRSQYDGQIFFHALHMGKNKETVPGITYPQDIRNCETCHDKTAAGGASWYTFPSIAACGSCHDTLNFTTGANHPPGPATDATCASCHIPDSGLEWDASVKGAHVVEYKSKQLHGLVMKILSVTQTAPGQKPVVKYQITDRNGVSMDPRPFDTLRFTLNGPTSDYASIPISEDAQATTTFDGTTATYTFQAAVPATAKNTWALTCDVELTVPLKQGDNKPDNTNFTESPLNPIFYIAMTDKTAVPRRTIVDIAKCNVCHDHLGAHGGQRLVTQGCVVCHNPVNDDSSQRPAASGSPESIDMRRMIHRIHSGDNLTQDFTIFGHGGRAVNFNDVTFPGDRRNCAKCHTSITTAELPTGAAINVATPRDFFSPQGPATAACLGCHDSRDVAAHAFLNTASFPGSTAPAEACATCHGTGAELAVDKVHAR
jgi:OmcA/MtrC family decaheme c-type cytochrome